MKEKRSAAAPIAVAATLLLLIPLIAYVAGYFAVSGIAPERWGNSFLVRLFPSQSVAHFYLPLIRIESAVRGEVVMETFPDH
jgi:hypothetical protein